MTSWRNQLKSEITLKQLLESFGVGKKQLRQWFLQNLVFVNGVLEDEDFIVKYHDRIEIHDEEQIDETFDDFTPLPVILYEDDFLLAVDKDDARIVHSNDDALSHCVAKYYSSTNQSLKIRHLHRLDKATSGIVLYAKGFLSQAYYTSIWDGEQIQKTYTAIVEGKVSSKSFLIDKPIGKDRHQNNRYLVLPNGKPSKTQVEVISSSDTYSVLKCRLLTGRTHQIRVHLSSIHHPIIGDAYYGSQKEAKRMMLHASEARVPKFPTMEELIITSPLPKAMQDNIFMKK